MSSRQGRSFLFRYWKERPPPSRGRAFLNYLVWHTTRKERATHALSSLLPRLTSRVKKEGTTSDLTIALPRTLVFRFRKVLPVPSRAFRVSFFCAMRSYHRVGAIFDVLRKRIFPALRIESKSASSQLLGSRKGVGWRALARSAGITKLRRKVLSPGITGFQLCCDS
ncbi:hypothetical protein BJX62DRAFT_27649 [Aspergillus germanicus]